ncbi:MAG: hypothetical protein LC778_10410 [Acidobacteria bacterium]|nr:hypothetical protein [Acidobacteriota bacterium]
MDSIRIELCGGLFDGKRLTVSLREADMPASFIIITDSSDVPHAYVRVRLTDRDNVWHYQCLD